jgi:hypothetical protein
MMSVPRAVFSFATFTLTHEDLSFPARLAAQLNNDIASPMDVGARGGNMVQYSRAKGRLLSASRKLAAREVAEEERKMGKGGRRGVGGRVVV